MKQTLSTFSPGSSGSNRLIISIATITKSVGVGVRNCNNKAKGVSIYARFPWLFTKQYCEADRGHEKMGRQLDKSNFGGIGEMVI